MYSAAGSRPGSSDEARAAIERLDFERQFGVPPGDTVEAALTAFSSGKEVLAAAILRPLAAAGDADAQYWLATALGAAEPNETIRWFRAAALQVDTEATYQLAYLLKDRVDRAGRPLADSAERARWLRRAAEGGHEPAMMELGEAYRTGAGVAESRDEAERWYKRAHRAKEGWSKLT